MDAFNTIKSEKYAQHDGLLIERRQLSWVVSGIVCTFFFAFLVGYYFGKRAQSGYYSPGIYDGEVAPVKADVQNTHSEMIEDAQVKNERVVTEGVAHLAPERYYAQLALYDSKIQADTLVAALKATDVIAHIKERTSFGPLGDKQQWYQVVTEYFDNKAALEDHVASVSKQEQLHDICFMCC